MIFKKIPRIYLQNCKVRPTLLIILLFITLSSCSGTIVQFKSDIGDSRAINSRANILVHINQSNLDHDLKKPESQQSIIDAIKNDLETNIFRFGKEDLIVHVSVEILDFGSTPWGMFWLPFTLLGAPMDKYTGEAAVSLRISTIGSYTISNYSSHKKISKWGGLYYGRFHQVYFHGGITVVALREALEDIKRQILGDRFKITRAIQKEKELLVKRRAKADDIAVDINPPFITLIKPSISRGMKKIVRENTITVRGKAVDESGIYEVIVNGSEAQLSSDGSFWADVSLLNGENIVMIKASDKYGNKAEKQFTVIYAPIYTRIISDATIDFELTTGKYYAMIIGINNYSGEWIPLQNAVHDAKGVAEELTTNYHFDQIIELYDEDATRANIIKKLEWMADNLNEEDNLLIYYSGHGEFKDNLNKGYWVPVDSRRKSTVNYISNSTLQTFLNGIPTQHTLLVSDACFSGDIFRSRTESLAIRDFDNLSRYYREVNKRISRQALTSGGVEPVMDGGRDGHSVFTYYFLKALKQNEKKYFDAAQVFEQLKIPVANNSEQTPILQAVKNTGDEGGQFIFIRK